MWGNTQPTLFEVSYGRISQQTPWAHWLFHVPHFTERRTNLEHTRHCDFQTLDVEHRAESRHPLGQPPGTTMETDEDGGRRRRRQMETDEDKGGDSRKRTQNHSGDERTGSSLTADAPPRVKTELDTSPLMQPADSRAHEGCSSRLSFI